MNCGSPSLLQLILSSDKAEWRLIPAALCRWRRCFLADQLWFMTRIQEEDYCSQCNNMMHSSNWHHVNRSWFDKTMASGGVKLHCLTHYAVGAIQLQCLCWLCLHCTSILTLTYYVYTSLHGVHIRHWCNCSYHCVVHAWAPWVSRTTKRLLPEYKYTYLYLFTFTSWRQKSVTHGITDHFSIVCARWPLNFSIKLWDKFSAYTRVYTVYVFNGCTERILKHA